MDDIYKVIRILSSDSILINVGSNQDTHIGVKYEVYEPGEKILDIDGKTVLGTLDYIKATVEITQIYDNFSIAQYITKKTEERNTSMLSAFNSTEKVTKTHVHELPINNDQIEPLNVKNKEISIGDPVRKK